LYLKIFLSIILILSSSLAQAQTFEGKQTVNKLISPEINSPTGTLTLGGTGGENETSDYESVANSILKSTTTGVIGVDHNYDLHVGGRFGEGIRTLPAAGTDHATYFWSDDITNNSDYGKHWHDQTDYNIAVGSGDLKLDPAGGEVIITDGSKLQVNSLGDDKNIQISHDDTDGAITTSSGDLVITPNGGAVNVVGAINSATLTVTSSADNTDVSGVNTMWVTTTGGAVVLGGLTGGVDGQVLYVVRKDTTNDLTLENAEGAGDQDFIMHQSADEVIDAGGAVLMCDGSDWYDISHARHV